MKNKIKNLVNLLTLTDSNGATFLGIREYKSVTTEEIANYVVISNFSYANAIAHDMKALQALTATDIVSISKLTKLSIELIEQAKNKLYDSFVKNQSKETQSNQSKAQNDTYIKINEAIKIHKETERIYLYALSHHKTEIKPANPELVKKSNPRELTKAQNVVKKYCNFKTIKYRMFVVEPSQLASVKANKQEILIS